MKLFYCARRLQSKLMMKSHSVSRNWIDESVYSAVEAGLAKKLTVSRVAKGGGTKGRRKEMLEN